MFCGMKVAPSRRPCSPVLGSASSGTRKSPTKDIGTVWFRKKLSEYTLVLIVLLAGTHFLSKKLLVKSIALVAGSLGSAVLVRSGVSRVPPA